jgi:predicted GNAT superfamily acetyltransferase
MIVIRSCQGHDELEACVQLQIETWGYDPTDVIPRKAFLVWQKVGGQVIGAFDTDRQVGSTANSAGSLIGFALSLPGIKTGEAEPRPYLHSHMLAVREGYRNLGLGARLKLEQRKEALGRGIRHMEWTFDPLEIKNAFLNIHKLGAMVRTYHADFYGVSSSRLQGGLPTDRLVAEWQLDSAHVQSALAAMEAGADPGAVSFKEARRPVIREQVLVPAAISAWKGSDAERERALAVQTENRHRFQQAFTQGLVVLGFTRDADGNGVYELGDIAQLE